jgi:hypothetical protein
MRTGVARRMAELYLARVARLVLIRSLPPTRINPATQGARGRLRGA